MPQFYDLPLSEAPQPTMIAIGRHGSLAVEKHLVLEAWCLHLYRDPMQLRVDGRWLDVRAGCATLIPPGAPIEFHFPVATRHVHFVAHFRARGQTRPFAAIQDLGAHFEPHYRALEEAVAFWTRDGGADAPHARARLWDVLWQLSQRASRALSPQAALVERATQLIAARLGEPLPICELARELEVSHNHLTRCFVAHAGQTPVAWIRARRLEHARYLLQHTTLPLKSIAAQTGLGDIHSLNKAMRRNCGNGPRAVRRALQTPA